MRMTSQYARGVPLALPRRMGPRKLLVPVDFTPRARLALRWAVDLARSTDGAIDLLHVVSAIGRAHLAVDAWLGRPIEVTRDDEVFRARNALERLVESVPAGSVPLRPRIEAGDPAATIVRVASEESSELIVLCTRGRYGLAELV